MKKNFGLLVVLSCVLLLNSCATRIGGAALGTGAGQLIGRDTKSTVIGGIIGALISGGCNNCNTQNYITELETRCINFGRGSSDCQALYAACPLCYRNLFPVQCFFVSRCYRYDCYGRCIESYQKKVCE